MSEGWYIVAALVFGVVQLVWGIHGILMRKRHSRFNLFISIVQIYAGAITLAGVAIYVVTH